MELTYIQSFFYSESIQAANKQFELSSGFEKATNPPQFSILHDDRIFFVDTIPKMFQMTETSLTLSQKRIQMTARRLQKPFDSTFLILYLGVFASSGGLSTKNCFIQYTFMSIVDSILHSGFQLFVGHRRHHAY
jgi:hypothetical protein